MDRLTKAQNYRPKFTKTMQVKSCYITWKTIQIIFHFQMYWTHAVCIMRKQSGLFMFTNVILNVWSKSSSINSSITQHCFVYIIKSNGSLLCECVTSTTDPTVNQHSCLQVYAAASSPKNDVLEYQQRQEFQPFYFTYLHI